MMKQEEIMELVVDNDDEQEDNDRWGELIEDFTRLNQKMDVALERIRKRRETKE